VTTLRCGCARLFGGQVALRDQFLHHAVVLAELRQLAVAPQVGTAVADPCHFIAVALHARGDHGGAHRQGVVAPARGADDLFVGGADGLASGAPRRISRTMVSRASALATSPQACPPMPSATSHRASSLSP
jgi:hypothetical protein